MRRGPLRVLAHLPADQARLIVGQADLDHLRTDVEVPDGPHLEEVPDLISPPVKLSLLKKITYALFLLEDWKKWAET